MRAAETLSADAVASGPAAMARHRSEGSRGRRREKGPVRARFDAYLALTKPRVIELLLVSTLPVMFLASRGMPDWRVALATLIGGYLAAGSANTFNCVIDADIDEKMRRTRRRPLPRHTVAPRNALIFGIVIGVASALILGLGANWLSAGLAVAANLFYVFIYSLLLKRRTWQNTIWGGIAGCFPPLIGWTAVTGSVGWPPIVLFLLVFFWTPPHTWSLGMRYREDYEAGGVPMLPVVREAPAVAVQILAYTVVTVLTSLVLWPVAQMNWLYPVVCVVAGAVFIWEAVQLLRRARAGLRDAQLKPMRLFHWSNTYLSLVFLAVAIDPLLP
ncbi:heme o synthase [Acidipropionibacterium acidipropionici]|nr:heme o synthase [Acidipropionibacterium acidipropionici]APZ10733.1 protoheme IX farnesyltransferase [Acidipropionibacterium acidipropionici]QCV94652.1 protoheme IX farnesyltransferase [Acidipropionibacterium acidipropionici]